MRFAMLLVLVICTGCDELLSVENPGIIDARLLDPARDAETFSLSARQNYAQAHGYHIVYGAWFTGEALSAETFTDPNSFARRDVLPTNGALLSDLWAPLSIARVSNEEVVRALAQVPDADRNVHVARAQLFAGFSYLLMAEHYCQGATEKSLLTTSAALDTAVARFSSALTVARAAAQSGPAAARSEANSLANAALVGRARAHLQAGRSAAAAADADQVAAGFRYDLLYADDPANRARLGNRVVFHTIQRRTLAIAPAFRGLNDPRVPVNAPQPTLRPFDGVTPFWTQAKYGSYATPIRLASRIEADYIAAEARGAAAMLALIQSRRAASGQPAYSGAPDAATVLSEFMEQRSRDFFLEGRRLGDARRQPGAVRNLPQPGAPYHKGGYAVIQSQTCWVLPDKETRNR